MLLKEFLKAFVVRTPYISPRDTNIGDLEDDDPTPAGGKTRVPNATTKFVFHAASAQPSEVEASDGAESPCLIVHRERGLLSRVKQAGLEEMKDEQDIGVSLFLLH